MALENPPLLVTCDTDRIVIRTNFTNTVQETHTLALDDLLDGAKRDLLRAIFTEPERLRPKRTRDALTAEAASKFSQLAQRLREAGHAPEAVAHFVNRLVFCMFAEDVGLLPERLFQRMLEASRPAPAEFAGHAATLFAAMKDGGRVGFTAVDWFNGGLFDDGAALPLERADLDDLMAAARLDWSQIDPSILGTLFERGLDPGKPSQLGAEALGLPRGFSEVGPEAVRGLEINPYAAELARVSVWIGEIQWMRANGFDASRNPILRPLDTIECRGAIQNPDGMVGLVVQAAGIRDRDGAPLVLCSIRARWPWLRRVFADGGHAGPKLEGALRRPGDWTIQIVKRSDTAKGFEVLPMRRVVERTFAWLGRCRRLAKDREKSVASAEAWMFIAHIRILTSRLARY